MDHNIAAFPTRVTVELTNDCNLNCAMCPRHYMTDKIGYMDIALWRKIIDEITPYNVTLVPFWRGESLLHPDIREMIGYAMGKVKEIQFATNGLLIPMHTNLLLSMDFVSVSYHTVKVLPWIARLAEARKNPGVTLKTLQISVVSGEPTANDICHLRPYADILRTYQPHSANGQFGSIKGGRPPHRKWCQKLATDITIAYNGDVSRCCHNWRTDKPLNVTKRSILDAWNGRAYHSMRADYPDDICAICDQWESRTVGTTEAVKSEPAKAQPAMKGPES